MLDKIKQNVSQNRQNETEQERKERLNKMKQNVRHLRVRSPKNGTAVERKIFVWHATIVSGCVIAIGLEK